MDTYTCFSELERAERHGTDYRVRVVDRPSSPALILAPHGGLIEDGTSEVAAVVAGEQHSLFCFEGLKLRGGNRILHITSHRFDHPECLALLRRSSVAMAIHGCLGRSQIYLGGLDTKLRQYIAQRLKAADLPVSLHGHKYPGTHPENICNRTRRRCGVQIELTMDLRLPPWSKQIALELRAGLDHYLNLNHLELTA